MIGRGVCTQAPCYCIVMEYCSYGQLYDHLRNNPTLSPALLVSWSQQIAAGMSYVHSHKIIHRDLKSPKLVFSDVNNFNGNSSIPVKHPRMDIGPCATKWSTYISDHVPYHHKIL